MASARGGIGADVGQGLRAARPAGARGDGQPGAGRVEDQSGGAERGGQARGVRASRSGTATARQGVTCSSGTTDSRSATATVSRPNSTTATSAVRPSSCGTAPREGDFRARNAPRRRDFRARQSSWSQAGRHAGGAVGGSSARRQALLAWSVRSAEEGAGGGQGEVDGVARGGAQPAVGTGQRERDRAGVERHQADVPTESDDVAAAVVERGQVPPGQVLQRRVGAQPGVQGGDPRA